MRPLRRPLDVPAGTTYLSCAHCGTRLKVSRTASAVFTEVMEQISSHTGAMAGHLETIRLQNELERLDREWMIEREKYGANAGDEATAALGGCVGTTGAIFAGTISVLLIIGLAMAMRFDLPPLLILLGGIFTLPWIVVTVGMVTGGVSSVTSASAYREAESAYLQRRQEIVSRLELTP